MDWSFLEDFESQKSPPPPPRVTISRTPVPLPEEHLIDRIGGSLTNRTEPNRHFDFGVLDKKGRRIGMLVYSASTDYQHEKLGRTVTFERSFTVTRDGELTNMETSTRWGTWEEAEADVVRHIAASAKRYAKLYRRA